MVTFVKLFCLRIFRSISNFVERTKDTIIHTTVYHRTAGDINFYSLDEDAPIDGTVVVFDQVWKQRMVYGYRFENRYVMRFSPMYRTNAVFTAMRLLSDVIPQGVIENDVMYTQFGAYSKIPSEIMDARRSHPHAMTA